MVVLRHYWRGSRRACLAYPEDHGCWHDVSVGMDPGEDIISILHDRCMRHRRLYCRTFSKKIRRLSGRSGKCYR